MKVTLILSLDFDRPSLAKWEETPIHQAYLAVLFTRGENGTYSYKETVSTMDSQRQLHDMIYLRKGPWGTSVYKTCQKPKQRIRHLANGGEYSNGEQAISISFQQLYLDSANQKGYSDAPGQDNRSWSFTIRRDVSPTAIRNQRGAPERLILFAKGLSQK